MAPAAPANVLDPLLQDLGAQQTESQLSQTAESQPSQTADDVGTKRSASYSESKDVQLCRSWIAISEDPLIRTNQDGATFWKRVHQSFSKDLPDSRRTPGSLKAHWGALQKVVSKFRGFVNQVDQFGESGASAKDCLNRALELFSTDQKCSFKYLCCYNILVKIPKWNSYTDENARKNRPPAQKKRARSPSSDAPASTAFTSEPASDAEADTTDTSSAQRPIGKKKAKLIHELSAKDDGWKGMIARAHESVAKESKRQNDIFDMEAKSLGEMAQTGKTNTQVSIMDKDLSNLDEDSKEYFRLKKKEILASLRSNPSSSSS
ncbi:uncharacterized protein PGTG_21049 [Puccinia graminis f. sp. tritici CRL 75-36-700-3]|uniref:No apical meristem-associated C-terminal domain-containing protein n=1 Tax=Puccinia graminis f. sp. tritici (strain CRL 75-36-700-3 / race SCCL) TaxID=418459 RepID=H6QQ97_PUCGT|nr:uncharacterized protein PGTG_21049 [Puccinia graminis f. sp. tritici CRL 75-36-700-3]EHS64789.1 hypothetical protein PGTG_21049 [Puccinia graminis f. sp. tritici CRL 75-36-700-3]